jgi:hypothetical protein
MTRNGVTSAQGGPQPQQQYEIWVRGHLYEVEYAAIAHPARGKSTGSCGARSSGRA